MLLWLKKLLKTRWYVDYVCADCENHYCGGCGRGVQEGNWFYTYRAAMVDAKKWVNDQIDDGHGDIDDHYELDIEQVGEQTNVVLKYKDGERITELIRYATISPRRYW